MPSDEPQRLRSAADAPGAMSAAAFTADHLAANLEHAPVWIFPVRLSAAESGDPRLGSNIYGAVQNLMPAARAYGIGSTLTTPHTGHEADVRRCSACPTTPSPWH